MNAAIWLGLGLAAAQDPPPGEAPAPPTAERRLQADVSALLAAPVLQRDLLTTGAMGARAALSFGSGAVKVGGVLRVLALNVPAYQHQYEALGEVRLPGDGRLDQLGAVVGIDDRSGRLDLGARVEGGLAHWNTPLDSAVFADQMAGLGVEGPALRAFGAWGAVTGELGARVDDQASLVLSLGLSGVYLQGLPMAQVEGGLGARVRF